MGGQRMKIKRKIEAMHERFGVESELCKNCDNFMRFSQCGFNGFKCKVYGVSLSVASDWRANWMACGMFNKEFKGTPLLEVLKHSPRKVEDYSVDEGQVEF